MIYNGAQKIATNIDGEKKMKRLKYFVVTKNNNDETVIVYDPEFITTYQARYAACTLHGGWEFLFTTTRTGNENKSVVRISPVSSFERAFRSVLSYMEKLPALHLEDFITDTAEELEQKLHEECDKIDRENKPMVEEYTGQESFLYVISFPSPFGDDDSSALGFDVRDFDSVKDAQENNPEENSSTISEEDKKKYCEINILDCYKKTFEGIEWVTEIPNPERQDIIQYRENIRKGVPTKIEFGAGRPAGTSSFTIGYLTQKKTSSKVSYYIVHHTLGEKYQLRVYKKSRPADRVGKTYVWRIDTSRDLKNGKTVYPCDPLRKVSDEEYISPILTAIEGDEFRPIVPTDKNRLRILKRLSVHSGGLTRQELEDDFYTNYIKAEQLEQWGNTPYKVDLEHADIIPVEFSDEEKTFRPVNLENGNYDSLHFIAQDELEENNLYTLTPDNLGEMEPLLKILSDRFTIQPAVVRKKRKLCVTVLQAQSSVENKYRSGVFSVPNDFEPQACGEQPLIVYIAKESNKTTSTKGDKPKATKTKTPRRKKSKLKYFVIKENNGQDRVLLFNPELTSLFQSRYFACRFISKLRTYVHCKKDVADDSITIMSVSNFENVFCSALSYMEQLPDFDVANYNDIKSHKALVEKLEQECSAIEAGTYCAASVCNTSFTIAGYINSKKSSSKVICHTGDKNIWLRVHPSVSSPETLMNKTFLWKTNGYRKTKKGNMVYFCLPIRKICDGNDISKVSAALDSEALHHYDESENLHLRILKRLCVHSGGMTRDEIVEGFINNHIEAEQIEKWGATPYTVDIQHAVITFVKSIDYNWKYVPLNLEDRDYDKLQAIAEDELGEKNFLTLTPDNLDEMKPLLETLSDRYTIQATEVRKKQKLHVTVL